MKIYCTNPNCPCPENDVPDELISLKNHKQRFCVSCGMSLILKTRYIPLQEIGEGGFGKTFRAWDSNLEQDCVVKQLQPRNPAGTSFSAQVLELIKQSFEDEAKKNLKNLRHEQIPQLYDYFELSAPPNSQNLITELFYLVQEYIPGETLTEELKRKGKFSESQVLQDLQELLPIFKYIHEKKPEGFLHRDIKPSNIIRREGGKLYLIDFGAAIKRTLEPGVPVEQSMAVGTPIFAPPEQLHGRGIFPSSDLYSLAATCVCLLTGKGVNELFYHDKWIWRQYARVSDYLADILDQMLLLNPSDRFQSAQAVIIALSQSSQPTGDSCDSQDKPENKSPEINFNHQTTLPNPTFLDSQYRRIFKVILPLGLVFLGLAIAFLINSWIHRPICDFQNQYGFSCGEQILIPKNPSISDAIYDYKIRGTNAFKDDKFNEAIKDFQKYLTYNQNDPEARIYLNNAKAAMAKNPLKVAASVPIIDDELNGSNDIAEQILRGFAHVQNSFNQNKGINGRLLFLEIASTGQKNKIKPIANTIVTKENILGVIGYYSSDSLQEAAPAYDGKIVAISPTSSAVRDSIFKLNNYIFRTSPDNSAAAEKLAKYMVRQNLKKVAIFYEPNETFAASLKTEFEKAIFQNKRQLVNVCPVIQSTTQASNCLQQAKESNAEVIMLAFSDKVARIAAVPIINQSGNITILGADTPYLESVSQANFPPNKVRIAVRWHRSSSVKSKFEQESLQLWGTGDVSWRTAMSYDATMAMVEGLRRSKDNYTRLSLYEALKNPAFSVDGVSAKVQFNDSGDREALLPKADRQRLPGLGVLVKVENNKFVIDEESEK